MAGRREGAVRGPGLPVPTTAAPRPQRAAGPPQVAQLLALQRGAGNRAATLAVQRKRGKKAQDPFELVANTKEQSSAVVGGTGAGLDPATWTGPTPPKTTPDLAPL